MKSNMWIESEAILMILLFMQAVMCSDVLRVLLRYKNKHSLISTTPPMVIHGFRIRAGFLMIRVSMSGLESPVM